MNTKRERIGDFRDLLGKLAQLRERVKVLKEAATAACDLLDSHVTGMLGLMHLKRNDGSLTDSHEREAERDALRKVVEAFTERIDRRLMSPLGVIRVHDSQGDAYLHEWASQVLPVIEKALAALAAQREEAK